MQQITLSASLGPYLGRTLTSQGKRCPQVSAVICSMNCSAPGFVYTTQLSQPVRWTYSHGSDYCSFPRPHCPPSASGARPGAPGALHQLEWGSGGTESPGCQLCAMLPAGRLAQSLGYQLLVIFPAASPMRC